jgi:superoxide reductase
MEEKHYIEWIQIIAGSKTYRQFLNPGQTPEASFMVEAAKQLRQESNVFFTAFGRLNRKA